MSRVTKIVCVLLVLLAAPLWLMMTMFSPMLFDAGPANMSKLQKLTGGGIVALLWALPIWVAYFGWRTLKGWRSPESGSAMLMALPAALIVGLFAAINLVR